jgi:hypothetical protein
MTTRPKLSLNHNRKSGTEVLTGNNNQLPKRVLGVTFFDGIEVIDHQPTTAAA